MAAAVAGAAAGPLQGLRRFKEWLQGFDLHSELLLSATAPNTSSTAAATGDSTGGGGVDAKLVRSNAARIHLPLVFLSFGCLPALYFCLYAREGSLHFLLFPPLLCNLLRFVVCTMPHRYRYRQLQFTQKHRSGRSRWSVPDSFPDPLVARAYLQPAAQYSTEPFAWSVPPRGPVRRFCSDRLGWTDAQVT